MIAVNHSELSTEFREERNVAKRAVPEPHSGEIITWELGWKMSSPEFDNPPFIVSPHISSRSVSPFHLLPCSVTFRFSSWTFYPSPKASPPVNPSQNTPVQFTPLQSTLLRYLEVTQVNCLPNQQEYKPLPNRLYYIFRLRSTTLSFLTRKYKTMKRM